MDPTLAPRTPSRIATGIGTPNSMCAVKATSRPGVSPKARTMASRIERISMLCFLLVSLQVLGPRHRALGSR